jgi:hypothetical protein
LWSVVLLLVARASAILVFTNDVRFEHHRSRHGFVILLDVDLEF